MKKIVVPTKTDRPVQGIRPLHQDAPRPRLGLRYGTDAEERVRQ
jgi:hypothetical protein